MTAEYRRALLALGVTLSAVGWLPGATATRLALYASAAACLTAWRVAGVRASRAAAAAARLVSHVRADRYSSGGWHCRCGAPWLSSVRRCSRTPASVRRSEAGELR